MFMGQVFVVIYLSCYKFAISTFVIPSDVFISMLSDSKTSQEKQAFLSAIAQVNADAALLPNTTVRVAVCPFFEEDPAKTALHMSSSNVSTLVVDSKPTDSHNALSSMLRIPLISTRIPVAQPRNQSFSDYGLSTEPNTQSVMLDLIAHHSWTNMIVLFDVRWRDHVTLFVSSLPSNVYYVPLELVLDQKDLINKTLETKLASLQNDPAEAIALFCDAALVQGIIAQAHPLLSHKVARTHRWLLADPIDSLQLVAASSQIIIGFAPHVYSNAKSSSLTAALSTNISSTRYSSFLVYDAVFAYAHALHDMLLANAWKSSGAGSDLVEFNNGDRLLQYLKKVNATGTTGLLNFDNGGHRKHYLINVMNLRGEKFIKIGEWTDTTPVSMTSAPTRNQLVAKVVPLNQLKRKLKIAVIEDPPFVMYEMNENTKTKELVGFSIDLIKGLADILQFEYEFYLSADGRYGGTNPDGSLAGVIGEVFKGNADMSSMPLTINSERLEYIGFSKPFMFVSMDLVIRKPKLKEYDITGFMTPYTIPVWIMTMVTWFVVSAILLLVNHFSPYGHRLCDEEDNGNEFSWFNSLWFCLASMLQQGGDCTPRMFSGRMVVGCFWFCILVWVSTYTANLAAFLTSSKGDVPITSLDDVLSRHYHLYIVKDTALYHYFRKSDYRVYRLLWERMDAENSFIDYASEGFDRVRADERAVYMEESSFAEYLVYKKPCDVMTAKDVMGSSTYGIAMPRDYPYTNNISIAILRMQENDKLENLKRKWWYDQNSCPKVKQPTSEEIKEGMRINVQSMVGVYVLLAGGGVVSIVVIFIEIWWKNRRDKINAKVRMGWAKVKSTTTVMGLRKKPDAITVIQAFQVTPKCDDLVHVEMKDGITNTACDGDDIEIDSSSFPEESHPQNDLPLESKFAHKWKTASKTEPHNSTDSGVPQSDITGLNSDEEDTMFYNSSPTEMAPKKQTPKTKSFEKKAKKKYKNKEKSRKTASTLFNSP